MINTIPGGEWFARFYRDSHKKDVDGEFCHLRVIVWVTRETVINDKPDTLVTGYVYFPYTGDVLPVEEVGSYTQFYFDGYVYQYKEEKIMRRETRSIA